MEIFVLSSWRLFLWNVTLRSTRIRFPSWRKASLPLYDVTTLKFNSDISGAVRANESRWDDVSLSFLTPKIHDRQFMTFLVDVTRQEADLWARNLLRPLAKITNIRYPALSSYTITTIYSRNSRWLLEALQNATNISDYMAVRRNEMSIILENFLDGHKYTSIICITKILNQFFFIMKMSKYQSFSIIKNLFYFPIWMIKFSIKMYDELKK